MAIQGLRSYARVCGYGSPGLCAVTWGRYAPEYLSIPIAYFAEGRKRLIEIKSLTSSELLSIHGCVTEELRARGVTRSSNNPVGDLTEHIFCKCFGWNQLRNSNSHIDATDSSGARYQIKGRRMTQYNKSRQLSAIRDLNGKHFDFIACALFNEDYSILRAALIPYQIVVLRSKFVQRTNSSKFILSDDIWELPDVRDVTTELRAVSL